MKYVHLFETDAQYQEERTNNYKEPWVSTTKANREVNYNKNTNGHAYVDLGLPSGVWWAACNVGANSPEARGDYYAWAEITTKSNYAWSTYKWGTSSSNLTKYNSTDNKRYIDLDDDAARVNMGGDWRMPTAAQAEELISYTNKEWVTGDGFNGVRLTSKTNGNSIFIPTSGSFNGTTLGYTDTHCELWCSSNERDLKSYGDYFNCTENQSSWGSTSRIYGKNIRAVIY